MSHKCIHCGKYWIGDNNKCPHCCKSQQQLPDENLQAVKDMFGDVFNI